MLVSVVCKNVNLPLDLLRKNGVEPLSNGHITPSNYFINGNSEAIPYEFEYTTNGDMVTEPYTKEFLEAWARVLRDHELVGLLGLYVLDKDTPSISYEVSDSDARINKEYYSSKNASAGMSTVSTAWRVDKKDGVIQVKKCKYCEDMERHHKRC